MWEIDEGPLTRFRCHVGHTFAAEHLSLSLDENLRRAMGSALRALEERLELARKLERDAEGKDQPHLAASWGKRASEYERELSIIRSAVSRMDEIDRGEDDYKAAE
ncbi:MAG: hypothetical protein JO245_01880 [Pseudolabrys sp.]|nr:hypothetical protein [Pseudolabrys sp.]